MSSPHRSYLPPEILDYIVDLLHNKRETLQQCCLVSKSWVPRTRRRLFADIRFWTPGELMSWKKTFPDPENSPAYHTRTLSICCPQVVVAADAEEGGWIRTFRHVVALDVRGGLWDIDESEVPLVLFHNFSPVLKSLRVVSRTLQFPQVFNLICSLPLLEDLCVKDYGGDNNDCDGTVFQPSSSPALTGALELSLPQRMERVTRQLLGLPNGLHFRKLVCTWYLEENLRWIMALLARCSDTLECVDIRCRLSQNPPTDSIDFSEATKLKEVVFRLETVHLMWVVTALQTITSEHGDLQRIAIHIPADYVFIAHPEIVRRTVGEGTYWQWMDLDRLFAQFWESHAIRPKIVYSVARGKEEVVREWIRNLLPEITERGIIDLVE